jgi:NAD(P)-dependent dehydrogenase (short-subunit alcohol dehydrogenase family)
MEQLVGRVAVVTGGAAGIGLGMVRAFAGEGMRVVIADVRKDAIDAAVAELTGQGHEAIGVPTDVSKLSEVEALAAATLDTFGHVHVLCNNAGVGTFSPISRTSIDDWEWMLGIDLWGPIYGVKTFLPLIEREEQGHINSTASIAGLVAGGAAGPYNVAKHGIVALMTTLERELRSAKSSVRTSVLCPGAVNTGIGRNSVDSRRAHQGKEPARSSVEGDKLSETVSAALASGMNPDDVGRLVLDAILTDTFWVFTDPRLLRHVQEQVATMVDERALSRLRLFGPPREKP